MVRTFDQLSIWYGCCSQIVLSAEMSYRNEVPITRLLSHVLLEGIHCSDMQRIIPGIFLRGTQSVENDFHLSNLVDYGFGILMIFKFAENVEHAVTRITHQQHMIYPRGGNIFNAVEIFPKVLTNTNFRVPTVMEKHGK